MPRRITGHRGSGANYLVARARENTAESCLLALAHGADSVEVDVQLSSDGELVVYHDARTSDGLRVTEQLYRQLSAHGIEHVADLMAQLPRVNGTRPVGVNLELKTGHDSNESELDRRVIDAVVAELPVLTSRNPVFLSSFDPAIVRRYQFLREHEPAILPPMGLISMHPHGRYPERTFTGARVIDTARQLGADAVVLNSGQLGLVPTETDLRSVDASGVGSAGTGRTSSAQIATVLTAVREAGLQLNVWCPKPTDAALLLRAGVQGVCVNWVPETVSAVGDRAALPLSTTAVS